MKLAYLIVLEEYGVEYGDYFCHEINWCISLDADNAYDYAHHQNMLLEESKLDDKFDDAYNWVKRSYKVKTLEII